MLPVVIGLAAGALVVAAARVRARVTREVEAECAARLPLGPDGIVVGAGTIELRAQDATGEGGSGPAVLLVHGAGDTPQTLRYLADALHARGFTVRVPLLPGHGRTVRHFRQVDADAWLATASAELDALRAAHPWTGLVGLSMGGALAARLAVERPDLPALVLIAPYLAMPALVRQAARTSWLWGPAVPYVRANRGRPSILDPEERERTLAYGWFTPAALRALRATMQAALDVLPRLRVPTLMLQSRDDNRIAPADAERGFRRIGAREKELRWVGGAHVLTVDRERAQVFDAVSAWLEAHGAHPVMRG